MVKHVPATAFKAECLRLIDEMNADREPVVVTRRGKPVALLSPIADEAGRSVIGALRGTVLRYDDPFAPASQESDWDALR